MKKIIIVNNNMKIGGVQKSLYNLLWALDGRYEITLLLFHAEGELLSRLPKSVKVVPCRSLFRFLGISQQECRGFEKLQRGFLRLICRFFTRKTAISLMLPSQKMLPQEYDCAIAYLQNGNIHNLYGGVQDFVLRRIKAKKKITCLHCDYRLSGANEERNNRTIARFDTVAACSDGCRRVFCQTMPHLAEKCVTVRNCHRFDEIHALAAQDTVSYEGKGPHVLMVTRLAHEKGVERALTACAECAKKGIELQLHIVGSGAMQETHRALAEQLGLKVHFYGEQANPYRFMPNAELLLMTSFYEAAPMVIEEAGALALPVLTTETTSSDDMVRAAGLGWVCANDQAAINESLWTLVTDPAQISRCKQELLRRNFDNAEALKQLTALIEG